MLNVPSMLLGAVLVALGVLAAAFADRIRGLRIQRESQRTSRVSPQPSVEIPVEVAEAAAPAPVKRPPRPAKPVRESGGDGEEVIEALAAAGFKKQAADATWACTPDERASIATWTKAALRRCRGGMS